MSKRFLTNFLVFLAICIGVICGISKIDFMEGMAVLTSDVFLRLLKLISLPIIFLSITSTISGMKDFSEMRKIGRKILTYTIGTTLTAATVALVLFVLIHPARIGSLAGAEDVVTVTKGDSYLSFLINIIPSNIFGAFVENNILGVAFIAFFLSIATLFLPMEQKSFLHQLFSSLFAAILKITAMIIKLIPLAIWSFVTLLIKELREGHGDMNQLFLYLSCVIGANLIQGIVILPLLLKFKKISPIESFRIMIPALTLAFFSKSSTATLPVTMRTLEKSGVSRKISSFTLPLCSVINMNGCAAFILTTVLFVSMLNGATYTPIELVGWILLASIAAIGNAGVPMGCYFLTSAFLIGMDVPLHVMGLILPFYTVMDMLETALNVWSDACITLSVDKDLAAVSAPVSS
ncbi:MAG: dicarboxylate/amino acid:cation symporter [Chlamydiia bacterium]|nr:dicarboxylate/amino acid:cation symporter [Chlamydiia bacterium]